MVEYLIKDLKERSLLSYAVIADIAGENEQRIYKWEKRGVNIATYVEFLYFLKEGCLYCIEKINKCGMCIIRGRVFGIKDPFNRLLDIIDEQEIEIENMTVKRGK